MTILGIIMMVVGLGFFGVGAIAFHGAFHERARARQSHCAAMDAKVLSDQYHCTGKVMYQQALKSYEEGQEFWQAATVALLDAKRREAKVDAMLEKVGKPLVILDPALGEFGRKEAV